MSIIITPKLLSQEPILLAFLMLCKFKQSDKHEDQTYIYTPDPKLFNSVRDYLNKFIIVFDKNGGVIDDNNVKDVQASIHMAKRGYFENLIQDIKAKVRAYDLETSQNLKFTTDDNLEVLNINYKGLYIASEVNPIDIFQEDLNESIAQRIVNIAKCYKAAKALSLKADFLEYRFDLLIKVFNHDYDISFKYSDDNAKCCQFIENIEKLKLDIDAVKQNTQLIKKHFEGIDLTEISVGKQTYSIKFKNPYKPNKTSIQDSPIYNIKSDANRIKQMLQLVT